MDDAFRLHHHVDPVHRHIEEPARLHDLQTFVDHGGGIHGDLGTHDPVGMPEGLFHRHMLQLFLLPPAEGPAGGCDQQTADGFSVLPVQGLENGTVFTVHRQDPYLIFLCQTGDQMACRHHGLLVGQGDVLAGFDGFDGRTYADHPHDGCHQDFGFGHGGKLQQTVHPGNHLHIQIRHPFTQIPGTFFIPYRDQSGMKFPCLLLQFFDVGAGADPEDFDVPVVPHHLQCLGSDGTRRSEYRNFFHIFNTSLARK